VGRAKGLKKSAHINRTRRRKVHGSKHICAGHIRDARGGKSYWCNSEARILSKTLQRDLKKPIGEENKLRALAERLLALRVRKDKTQEGDQGGSNEKSYEKELKNTRRSIRKVLFSGRRLSRGAKRNGAHEEQKNRGQQETTDANDQGLATISP